MQSFEKIVRPAILEVVSQIKDGYTIGMGSGRTMACVIKELGRIVKEDEIDVKIVPSSYQVEMLAVENKLNTVNWSGEEKIDLAIDGADQVEINSLDLIKGGGAALTREKILDSRAKELIIIIDEKKLTDKLGLNQPIPVEVIPFGYKAVLEEVRKLKGEPILREANRKVGPVITDNSNFIIDILFKIIENSKKIEKNLKLIPGVVESGLFVDMADKVYVAKKDSEIEVIERN